MLKYEHVSSEYQEEFAEFLQKEGFTVSDTYGLAKSFQKKRHVEELRPHSESAHEALYYFLGVMSDTDSSRRQQLSASQTTYDKQKAQSYMDTKAPSTNGKIKAKLNAGAKIEHDSYPTAKPVKDGKVKDGKAKKYTKIFKPKPPPKPDKKSQTILEGCQNVYYDTPEFSEVKEKIASDQQLSQYSGELLDIYDDIEHAVAEHDELVYEVSEGESEDDEPIYEQVVDTDSEADKKEEHEYL